MRRLLGRGVIKMGRTDHWETGVASMRGVGGIEILSLECSYMAFVDKWRALRTSKDACSVQRLFQSVH